jgi:hypothetical protein
MEKGWWKRELIDSFSIFDGIMACAVESIHTSIIAKWFNKWPLLADRLSNSFLHFHDHCQHDDALGHGGHYSSHSSPGIPHLCLIHDLFLYWLFIRMVCDIIVICQN